MENFIKSIKSKDKELSKFFEKKDLRKLEEMSAKLEEEHREIKEHLKEVDYLLDLIAHHEIEATASTDKQNTKRKNWLDKIKTAFEDANQKKINSLSDEDITFLKKEKSKLMFEKGLLEKEHFHIHQLIAKTEVLLMDAQNDVCKEITKNYDIAAVGEKLLEYFGKELDGETDYESGRAKIRKMLEKTFSINKQQSKELFDLLEKTKVVSFKVDYSSIVLIQNYDDFDPYTDTTYAPIFGNWEINA